ncbi:MAG: peptide MFS transporter, partial [Acidobacteriota bacterium]
MPSTPDLAPGPGQPALDRSFFGHPRSLSTLFFTEMWERFSYYGMRALLILFMTASVASGGLGFDTAKAGAIYGLYTAGVYLMALPGGYLADRLLGQQRSVFVGGVLIAAGHFAMVFHAVATFYLGLVLIILGTGLLKPNISAIVGDLYGREDERRDAGFSIFYMGINVGGFAAPLLCGYLGEEVDWHLGFGLAGVGMVAGLIQYVAGQRSLPEVGRLPQNPATPAEGRRIWTAVAATLAVAFAAAVAMGLGVFTVDVVKVASVAVVLIASAAALYFAYLLTAGGLDATEKRHVGAVAVLFVFSTFFWLGFEQSGSSMNL